MVGETLDRRGRRWEKGVDNEQDGVDNEQDGVDNEQDGVDNEQDGVDNEQDRRIQANRPSVETSHEEESEYEEIVDRQSPSEYESLDALSREKVSEYETLGNVRRESLSQNICDKLASMGFDVDDCRDAVQAGNKTVEDSIEWIQANRAAPVEVNQQPSIGHPENGENSENAEGGPIEVRYLYMEV
ncbi:hypothetical protein LSAT2_003971 [Lamellibrachia satsuma]|nr:hypothetical protein LSAT2_003971 [Lamellibrachia satsuma]